jgi:hypothetical protein
MPDFTQPVELPFIFGTIGVIFGIIAVSIILVKKYK